MVNDEKCIESKHIALSRNTVLTNEHQGFAASSIWHTDCFLSTSVDRTSSFIYENHQAPGLKRTRGRRGSIERSGPRIIAKAAT